MKNKDGNTFLKLEEDLFKEEDELALGNSLALNAIFNGVGNMLGKSSEQLMKARLKWGCQDFNFSLPDFPLW